MNPTVEYLRRALRADKRVDALIERAERLRAQAEKATSLMTAAGFGGGGPHSNVERCAVALVDLAEEIERAAAKEAEALREVQEVIERVPNARHRELLRWRYLSGWTWEKIAEALGLDLRWVYRVHGKALRRVEAILTIETHI